MATASALLAAGLAVGAGTVAAERGPRAASRSASGLAGAVRRGLPVSRSRKPVHRTERAKPGFWVWWRKGQSTDDFGMSIDYTCTQNSGTVSMMTDGYPRPLTHPWSRPPR